MRIGLISTLSTPVRREGSDSVEGLVWLLSRELTRLGHAVTVFACVDTDAFTFRPEPLDYVCYLGRFTAGKGPLQAIAAARALGVRLLLAGPADDYYRRHVEPLVDGRLVQYVGYVSGEQRSGLLGGA